MKDLKCVFFCISDPETPWLSRLMTELDEAGVRLYTLDGGRPVPEITLPEGSYTVTDNDGGIRFAARYDTGYVLYQDPSSKLREKTNSPGPECVIEGFDEISPDFLEKMYQRKQGIPWTILETERTVVRELCLSDIDDLFTLYEDPEIKRFIPPLLPTKEEEREFQKAYIESMYGFFGYGFWLVSDRESGALMGRAGLSNRAGFEEQELGYLLAEKYRGRGIAAEVCRAIMSYAARVLGAERLNAFIHPENTVSVRFAEKLGFRDTGEEIESEGRILKRFTAINPG